MIRLTNSILLALCLFGSGATGFANVGESEAAVTDRYGKSFGQVPTATFGVISGFIAGGYVVGVKFVDGTSEMEMFSKGDKSDMPASEIGRLLQKSSPGEWKAELTGKPQWRRWRRDDGSAVALYDAVRHFLYVTSKNFYELKGAQMEQQEWNFNNAQGSPAPATGGINQVSEAAPSSTPSPSASP
jgi:hypothetical protein